MCATHTTYGVAPHESDLNRMWHGPFLTVRLADFRKAITQILSDHPSGRCPNAQHCAKAAQDIMYGAPRLTLIQNSTSTLPTRLTAFVVWYKRCITMPNCEKLHHSFYDGGFPFLSSFMSPLFQLWLLTFLCAASISLPFFVHVFVQLLIKPANSSQYGRMGAALSLREQFPCSHFALPRTSHTHHMLHKGS